MNVKIINKTVDDWDENTPTVIATGPLTVGALSDAIIEKLGQTLHFYDAAAPIIAGDSIDYAAAFTGDRYGKGTGDYVNCPMTKEEYANFYTTSIPTKCLRVACRWKLWRNADSIRCGSDRLDLWDFRLTAQSRMRWCSCERKMRRVKCIISWVFRPI